MEFTYAKPEDAPKEAPKAESKFTYATPEAAHAPAANPALVPPVQPAHRYPGAAGVHGDPFPERATTEMVPDLTLQQTEVPPNPVPHTRIVPKMPGITQGSKVSYYEK